MRLGGFKGATRDLPHCAILSLYKQALNPIDGHHAVAKPKRLGNVSSVSAAKNQRRKHQPRLTPGIDNDSSPGTLWQPR